MKTHEQLLEEVFMNAQEREERPFNWSQLFFGLVVSLPIVVPITMVVFGLAH